MLIVFRTICEEKTLIFKSNLTTLAEYYAEMGGELVGPFSTSLRFCNDSFFQRNAAAVPSRWQHCVQLDRPKIRTLNSRYERVTARPTDRTENIHTSIVNDTVHSQAASFIFDAVSHKLMTIQHSFHIQGHRSHQLGIFFPFRGGEHFYSPGTSKLDSKHSERLKIKLRL